MAGDSSGAKLAADGAIPLSAFLDGVAGVLRVGLPARLWIAATVVDVRATASGHTLELTDPAAGLAATLRVFLASGTLAMIRRDLGVPIDPTLLVGMTTAILVAPNFSRRWHLGGRIEALAGSAAASLRQRLIERTIAALKTEGLWDRQRRLPRPRDVTRIAVIHPLGAAGWADIEGELGRWERAGICQVRSHPTRFEGDGAAAAIVAALVDAMQPIDQHRADLILLVRGGGARAALVVLDDDIVVRAILGCPIPVVCGTGHATDRSIADQVCFREAHTPSKALGFVAALIGDAARTAQADTTAVLTIAAAGVATHQRSLQARQDALVAGFGWAVIASAQDLAALWSEVRIATTRRRETMARLGDGATVLWRAVLAAAPAALKTEERASRGLIGDCLDRAWRIAGRHDDGAGLFGALHQAAHTRLDRHEASLAQQYDNVGRHADRLLLDTAADLGRLQAVLDGSDIAVVLRRGFAIVTDPAGTLLPTRAVATASNHLVIHFTDGALEAIPDRNGDPVA